MAILEEWHEPATPLEAGQTAVHRDASRPLRICLLSYRSNPLCGGQGVYLRHLSKALAELGHRVTVLSGPPYPELLPEIELVKLEGMDLYANGLGSLRLQHLRSASNLLEWLSKLSGGFAEPQAFGQRMVRYLLREGHARDYDIIHDNQTLCYGLLTLQKKGLPVVTTLHHPITRDLQSALLGAPWWQRPLIRRWYRFLSMQKKVARQLHHLVFISTSSRNDSMTDFGIRPEQARVIHNGVDHTLFRPLPQLERHPCQLLTTCSADQPMKGLRHLLEAVAQLAPDHPKLELLIIGKLRPDGDNARRIRQLGIESRVQSVSGISDEELVRRYATATVAVVPSLYEGFSFPAVEAMACATPLVSTDGGALPEVVGTAGLVVESGNSRALATALDRLLKDPALREHHAEAGRQRVLEKFSWRQTALQFDNYYRQILTHADH